MTSLFRKYCSDLTDLELRILDTLLSRGKRFGELPDSGLPFINSLQLLLDKNCLCYEISNGRYYLTAQGREIWEAERCPQWDYFIIELGPPIAELNEALTRVPPGNEWGQYASPSGETLDRFCQALQVTVQAKLLGSCVLEKLEGKDLPEFSPIYAVCVELPAGEGTDSAIDYMKGLWWRDVTELQPLLQMQT